MPNRILRDGILTSEKVNQLSELGELFYRRLMSVLDDFGRYPANPRLLRSALYPLRTDRYSLEDLQGWLDECVRAQLVLAYTVDGRPYLELLNFNQRTRAKVSKCPPPDGHPRANDRHMTVTCRSDDSHMRTEAETETETEASRQPAQASEPSDAEILAAIPQELIERIGDTPDSRMLGRIRTNLGAAPLEAFTRRICLRARQTRSLGLLAELAGDVGRSHAGRPVSAPRAAGKPTREYYDQTSAAILTNPEASEPDRIWAIERRAEMEMEAA